MGTNKEHVAVAVVETYLGGIGVAVEVLSSKVVETKGTT